MQASYTSGTLTAEAWLPKAFSAFDPANRHSFTGNIGLRLGRIGKSAARCGMLALDVRENNLLVS